MINKWCTYGSWGKEMPTFIGKLEKQEGNIGYVRYTERQMYPVEAWDMDYVKVFDSIEDAILYMVRHNSDESVNTIKEWLTFPTDTKNVNWELLKALEIDMQNNKKSNG